MSDSVELLAKCREKIDQVDRKLVALLNERTAIVEEVGQIKKAASMRIYEPRREDQVFENVTSNNQGPLPHDAVKRIFERIIDEMRKIQKDRMGENS